MLRLTQLLNEHLKDVHDSGLLYEVGREYDRLGQCSAAIPFYLRACDKEWEDTLLQYACLLRMVIMYHRLGRRDATVEGILQNAVTLRPDRPEAWYWYAKTSKEKGKWKQTLMYASVGLQCEEPEEDIDVDYPGHFGLSFYECIADWYVRGIQESKEKTFALKYWFIGPVNPTYEKEVDMLLGVHKYPKKIMYNGELSGLWKYGFPGLESITKNYSPRLQDMIVLTMLNGKREGTFLELGTRFADRSNNTYLLEKEFGWKGLTIEPDHRVATEYKKKRSNYYICKDPLSIDFEDLLETHSLGDIDYLQINSKYKSYQIVMDKIPWDLHRFKIVSFHIPDMNETDNTLYKNKMRQKGYTMLAGNIFYAPDNDIHYHEDIWVHLPSMDADLFNQIKQNESDFIVDNWFDHVYN